LSKHKTYLFQEQDSDCFIFTNMRNFATTDFKYNSVTKEEKSNH